jgi:hypothetical protein
VTAYLSTAWIEGEASDPAAEALAAEGGTASIGRVVTGAPDGEARFTVLIDGGSVRYQAGLADDVDLSLTDTYANAVAILSGEADPNALFMRGRTKVAGSTRVLLDLLAATRTDAYRAARDQLAASVEV